VTRIDPVLVGHHCIDHCTFILNPNFSLIQEEAVGSIYQNGEIMSVNHAPTSASLSGLVARDSEMVNNAEEIPFLVTHWLANYKSKATEGEEGPEHEQAMQRIRKATSEIASAFSSLGAYGTSYQVWILHNLFPSNFISLLTFLFFALSL
jgi:hypothetical protein